MEAWRFKDSKILFGVSRRLQSDWWILIQTGLTRLALTILFSYKTELPESSLNLETSTISKVHYSSLMLYPWFQCSTLKCCCWNYTVYCEALLHYLKSYTSWWSLDIVIQKSSVEFLSDGWQQHGDRSLSDDRNIEKIQTDIKQKVNYIKPWKPSQPPWSVSFLQASMCLKSVRAQIHDRSKSDTRMVFVGPQRETLFELHRVGSQW